MEFKITYVPHLNDLNITNVHKTEIQNKTYVLSTQKSSWKMQEMKLIRYKFYKFKCTLLEITKAKVYKTPALNVITFCWIHGLPWLAANVVLLLFYTDFSLRAQESVMAATTFEFLYIHFDLSYI